MSRWVRNLLCVWVGAMLGGFGGLLVAIFWPLLFPLSLGRPSRGEDNAAIACLAFFLLFAIPAFFLCRRLTKKHVREDHDVTGRVLFR
jgi:hypothetical protein